MKLLSKLKKLSFAIWLFCLIADLIIFSIVIFIRKELFNTAPTVFVTSFLIILIIGCLAFSIGIIGVTISYITANSSHKKENIFKRIFKFIVIIAIFPLFIFLQSFKPIEMIIKIKKSGQRLLWKEFKINTFSKIFRFIITIFILGILTPTWLLGYFVAVMSVKQVLGYNPEAVSIAGTGSMYPTFPKSNEKDRTKQFKEIVGTYDFTPYPNGVIAFGKRYFGYELHRDDIVVAENKKIKENNKKLYGEPSGVIKRIIALPDDSLEIRGGLVYLNNKPLTEPYTAKSHSTFGEGFLGECKKIIIPNGKLFIMGDNRKGSGDSREFGLVDFNDIKAVVPLQKQTGKLDVNFRDTSKDLSDSTKIKLNKEKYLELLNIKRKEAGVKLLKYQPLLEKSAGKRGEVILKYNDFSFEATKSGTTMEQAMYDVGYSNIIWGEAPTQGYYEAEELIDNQFEYPRSKEFLLNKNYQEVGIAEVEGEINGCPTQVVVQHFAGYIPPNYKQSDIDSWKKSLNSLHEVQPNWEAVKSWGKFYDDHKEDVDRITTIINQRINNMSAIVSRMEANQWLTTIEKNFISNDKALYDEQEGLATKLNKR